MEAQQAWTWSCTSTNQAIQVCHKCEWCTTQTVWSITTPSSCSKQVRLCDQTTTVRILSSLVLKTSQECKTFLGNLFHCLTVPVVKELFHSIWLELPFQFLTTVCQPVIMHIRESLHFLSLPPCRYWKAAIKLHQRLHFSRLKRAHFPLSPHLLSVFQPSDHLGGLQLDLLRLINIFPIVGEAKTECTIPDVAEWVWSKGEQVLSSALWLCLW